jgi:hypothetical protein
MVNIRRDQLHRLIEDLRLEERENEETDSYSKEVVK